VNRNEYDVDGPQIELAPEEGIHYFDLYHGVELKAAKNQAGRSVLSSQIEAHRLRRTPGLTFCPGFRHSETDVEDEGVERYAAVQLLP
jgi:hypothetical protein